jgi:hypothetical protein
MGKTAETSEPSSELEHLIADLSESGQLVFVFGVGWWTAHLAGATALVFRGPAGRRWWHVELGDDAASWPGPITDRTFNITFPDPGVQAYCFTFG